MTAGGSILAEKKNGKWQQYLYDGSGQLMAIRYKGADYYYIRDGLMCITGLVDANGGAVVNYRYDSWGKLISITGSMADTLGKDNPYRYKGYYYDDETGMYYLKSRYYQPEICRFISADDEDVLIDTHANLSNKNLYLYCDNNPILRKDDEGEFWHIIAAGAVSAAIGMGTTIAQNIIDGNDWKDGLVESAVTGFVSGAIAGSGLGLTAQNVAQAAVTVAADGYDLWKKSKTKEGITAYDITFAVMDVAVGVKDGIPKEKDVKEWKDGHRIITQYYDSVDNLKRGKKGGKRGVIEKRREKVKKNRKNAVRYSVKRTSPSGLPNAYAVAKYVIQKRGKKYYKKFKKWLRKFK